MKDKLHSKFSKIEKEVGKLLRDLEHYKLKHSKHLNSGNLVKADRYKTLVKVVNHCIDELRDEMDIIETEIKAYTELD